MFTADRLLLTPKRPNSAVHGSLGRRYIEQNASLLLFTGVHVPKRS